MTGRNQWLAVAALVAFALAQIGADDGLKIGVIDMQEALSSTDQGKSAREELARKEREAQNTIQPMIERRSALQEEIRGKKYVLSESALFDKQVEMAELTNQIESKYKELEGQLKIDQGRILAPLQAKMMEIIEKIGKEQGFTVILQRDAPGLVYSREALDITDMVVGLYNKQS